ncbi:hypothetical protein LPJ75_000740 [Coemansia sp. RSA 2598]|nr:hypothetical protein LPJ75_000740 [Coemansia sp. RSA 2598]
MFVRIAPASVAALVCAVFGLSASAHPVDAAASQGHVHHAIARRAPWNGGFFGNGFGPCGNCGFFPFAFNSVNAFDRNAFAANSNENTFFQNNKNSNVAADNVNAFNSANVIG